MFAHGFHPCDGNYRGVTQITQILLKKRKFIAKYANFYAKYAKIYATSEGWTTQKFSNPFEKYAFFTKSAQILRKIRKIRKINAKTQNLQKNNANFTQITQIYAKIFLRSYTKILSGQPLGNYEC